MDMDKLEIPKCYYPTEYPELEDIVAVKILRIEDSTISCELLEYGCKGMMLHSEVSKRKLRNITRSIHVARQEYLEVIDVDTEKGYIDLSKKNVTVEEQEEAVERFSTARRLYNFFRHWSEETGMDLVTNVLWKYYDPNEDNVYKELAPDLCGRDDNAAWREVLNNAVLDSEQVERICGDFLKLFETRVEKHVIEFEMVCYASEGVEALTAAILEGLKHSTAEAPIEFVNSGKTGQCGTIYVFSTQSKSEDAAVALENAVHAVKDSISKYAHEFRVRASS